jgi:hypothetical protein
MTLPSNLFIDTPEMEDASLVQLESDSATWPELIIQKFKERIPQASSMNMMVKFMKQDDENGVATGSIIVNSNSKAAVIPIIIKDFMMYPLDIMIAEQKLLPLTSDYWDAIFGSKNDVFSKIEEFPTYGGLGRFEDANLWNAAYPPSLGRYAYASAGGYPILEAISETINGKEFKEFLTNPANEKTAARLLSREHKDVVVKLANLQPVNMNEYRQGADNLIPRSVAMLRKEGPNKYTLLSNYDNVFNPSIVPLCNEDLHTRIGKISDHVDDDINEVDQNGEKMLIVPQPHDPVFLAKADEEIPEEAKEFDHYSVKTKTGVSVEGYVIPTVIDFDQKKVDLKIFIGKTMSTLQPNIWGVRVKNSRFSLDSKAPRLGQSGTFVYQPDKSHALATIPVTIKEITQRVTDTGEPCDQIQLKVIGLAGQPYMLTLAGKTSDTNKILKASTGNYILPPNMKWIPMDDFGEVTNSAEDYSVKQAAFTKTDHPVYIIHTGFNQYSVKGLDKYAAACNWDKTNLDEYKVKFLLHSLGVGETKLAQILKQAHRRGDAEIHNLRFIPTASEKVATAVPKAEKIVKFARKLKTNLAKEASYLENAQTVDALLSLNFITPDNITKFVSKIPQLKSAISTLASCLIASRLGIKEIPEQATSTALLRLVEVTKGLEMLRSTQEMGTA